MFQTRSRLERPLSGRFPTVLSTNVQEPQQPSRRPHQSLPSEQVAQNLTRQHYYPSGRNKINHSVPDLAFPRDPRFGSDRIMDRTEDEATSDIPRISPFQDKAAPSMTSKHKRSSTKMENKQSDRTSSREGRAMTDSRRPTVPKRTSSIRGAGGGGRPYTDRDVLRGLNVAASAACDEDVDAYVRHKTGLQIRRFLADLVVLETLGDTKPPSNSEIVKQRRKDMRKLKQHVRRTREFKRISGIDQ